MSLGDGSQKRQERHSANHRRKEKSVWTRRIRGRNGAGNKKPKIDSEKERVKF